MKIRRKIEIEIRQSRTRQFAAEQTAVCTECGGNIEFHPETNLDEAERTNLDEAERLNFEEMPDGTLRACSALLSAMRPETSETVD